MNNNIGLKHVEQARNNGMINCPTQLHLVGHFYKICIMMHGSLYVKRMNAIFNCNFCKDMFGECSHISLARYGSLQDRRHHVSVSWMTESSCSCPSTSS